MFKCSLPTTRMEEEGISNVYIDDLMNKISKTFCGTFSIDNIPVIENDVFPVIVNLSEHWLLLYHNVHAAGTRLPLS